MEKGDDLDKRPNISNKNFDNLIDEVLLITMRLDIDVHQTYKIGIKEKFKNLKKALLENGEPNYRHS